MREGTIFSRNIKFIVISGIGGFLLSLTGMWMIGTLLVAAFLSFRRPPWLSLPGKQKGLNPYFLRIGQCILGIELGQKINLSIVHIFKEDWLIIIVILLLSILFSVLSGFILWKFSRTDMLTSFFGTAPGGLSAMPGIAEEVGANTAVVSIIQTMRVFLVVLTIPLIASTLIASPAGHTSSAATGIPAFELSHILWTIVLAFVACGGALIGKRLKFPAPWLVGGMASVAIVQSVSSSIVGHDIVSWWPHSLIVVAQILMGSSIGSRFHKNMLAGLRKTLVVALLGTLGLIAAMLGCAFVVSKLTGITFVTAALAFAPGGVAEMATMSVVLHADSTLVVAVQVIRIISVCIILPPLFTLIHHYGTRKGMGSHA
ncbi:AbrB family transcriptional regulator [Fictibacillus gelatini]|uniref:AbrB family transcriptional regulator n=1 Tax=Fictibacillus gelatini TaxID=225985 RepID=UPI000413A262|nr:AbrB family transcriptional regulator [Fictibacillus gelatini]